MKELSKLELKLRKQIRFMNCTPRQIEQRAKQVDILRNIITDSKRHRKIQKNIKRVPKKRDFERGMERE